MRRTANQSFKDNQAAARRYALVPSTNVRTVKSFYYPNIAPPGSPLRLRSKYELRSISFEGSKVLPWTSR